MIGAKILKAGTFAEVKDGKLTFREDISQGLSELDGKSVVVTIEPYKSQRSLEQNRLYWGSIVSGFRQSFQAAGYVFTVLQVHDYLKRCFLSYTLPMGDDEILVVSSTTDLSVDEFSRYIEDCEILHIDRFGRGLL